MPVLRRYVAVGDSSTEGLDDPDGAGGWRGWADRLAALVARAQGTPLEYANLAVRGRRVAQVRAEQLEPAVALEPDLASCFAGVNDLLRRSFDAARLEDDLGAVLTGLRGTGATVLTLTMPDLWAVNPLARLVRDRAEVYNATVRELAGATGAVLLDLAGDAGVVHPALWSADRLHANAEGHARIAAALAGLLGVEAGEHPPLPVAARRRPVLAQALRARDDALWTGRHLAPWLGRRVRGASSGDGVSAKHPRPVLVAP